MNFKNYLTKDEKLNEGAQNVNGVFFLDDIHDEFDDMKERSRFISQIIKDIKEYYNCTAKFEVGDKFRISGKPLDVARCLYIGAGKTWKESEWKYSPTAHGKQENYEGTEQDRMLKAIKASKYWKNGKFNGGSEKSKLI